MLKIIQRVPKSIHLYISTKYSNYNYLFVFGWLGFIKYKLIKRIKVSTNYQKFRAEGKKALFFTYLKIISNFYLWTSDINKKIIFLQGVGFKYRLIKNKLYIILGYSHIIDLTFCRSISLNLVSNKILELYSINLFKLNDYVYKIKGYKKLDVYKGKGILLGGETITKKEGKKATF